MCCPRQEDVKEEGTQKAKKTARDKNEQWRVVFVKTERRGRDKKKTVLRRQKGCRQK